MSEVDLRGKTILVTGAAGFIGGNLVKRLYNDVENVTVIGIDTPATVTPLFKILLLTTAFAPIATSLSIIMSPITFAPVPIKTLSPILGAPPPDAPIVTPSWIRQYFPILALLFTQIAP